MAEPTADEQYMLELINLARSDPEAEAARLGIDLNEGLPAGTISADPKQPLAFNLLLIDAARDHSAWMLKTDTFSHTGEGGSSAEDRMADAGYAAAGSFSWGENVAWSGSTGNINETTEVAEQHDNLFLSESHRTNILHQPFGEIGVGQQLGLFTKDGNDFNAVMTTQNFATISGVGPFLTGVAYDDTDSNDFYSVGEGLAGLTVEAVRQGDGMVFSTQTMAAGGYQMELAGGTYTVSAAGGGLVFQEQQVTVADENVKLDFEPLAETAPTLAIVAADAVGQEGDSGTSAFIFTVTRSGDLTPTTTVDYQVSGADPDDFAGGVRPFGTVSLAPGELEKSVTITIAGDTEIEADESFTVTLSSPSGDAVIATASASGTIENDDTLGAPPASPTEYGIVLENDGPRLIDTGSFARLIDAPGDQQFNVAAGASLELQASRGMNAFTLAMDAAEVEVSRQSATVILTGPNGETIAFAARSTPQTVVFEDATLGVVIADSEVLIGDQPIIETPEPVTPVFEFFASSVGLSDHAAAGSGDLLLG